ncbi:MAG: hypothetical protein Q8K63_03875, partial [Acidimicrobiales bacterium]|nr:hypothetical protein [Acidimicrobiales bacterium]
NAEWVYRERFLAEKYGIDIEPPPSAPAVGAAAIEVVSIEAALEAEMADKQQPAEDRRDPDGAESP